MSKQEGNGLVRGKDIKGAVVVLSKTQPQQLSLFQTFLPDDERYSNTIDLYDAIPKYFPRKRLKKGDCSKDTGFIQPVHDGVR